MANDKDKAASRSCQCSARYSTQGRCQSLIGESPCLRSCEGDFHAMSHSVVSPDLRLQEKNTVGR
jgi:hypothetical protein